VSLELYMHPFAAFCQKVLIALYENATPFATCVIDLGDARSRSRLTSLWPVGRFPVLRDTTRDRVVAESSIIIEYLDRYCAGPVPLVPGDPEVALEVRFLDRFYDLYVAEPMQKIVTDRLRPAGEHDLFGVERARGLLEIAYGMIERQMAGRAWAAGAQFTMADCAAAPALFYAELVAPFGARHPALGDYLARLKARPSFARVIREAEPWFHLFPSG
jgi:glutathione S-transferase